MSTNITKNRILDFTISLQVQHRSANTIISYTTNIQKLELFLNGAELSKEQMLAYKCWLSEQGFKQRTINAYLAAANQFCDVMGWQKMKVMLYSKYTTVIKTGTELEKDGFIKNTSWHSQYQFVER